MKTVFVLCAALTVFQILDVSVASAIQEANLEKENGSKTSNENPEKVVTVNQTENNVKMGQHLVEDKLANEDDLKINNKLEAESKPLEVTNEPASNMVTEQITPEGEQKHQTQSNIEESSANQEGFANKFQGLQIL